MGIEASERAKYSELIDAIKKRLANPDLVQTLSLNMMHIARNDAQHHGIIPCLADVQRYKVLTYQTLSDLSKEALKKDFEEISLSDQIKDSFVRSLYKKAEIAYLSGNFRDSLIYSASAFEKAKRIEQSRLFGSGLALLMLKTGVYKNETSNEEILNVIIGEIEVLKLRLDYKRYQKYREIFGFGLKPFSDLEDSSEKEIINWIKKEITSVFKDWESESKEIKAKQFIAFLLL